MKKENFTLKNMNKITPILAIETSGKLCGVCVYKSKDEYYSSKILLSNSHSEKIFGLIQKTLSESDLTITEINSIAVSNGPGSFTGLRIGSSAAKGISSGASIPIIQVPTFEAMAFELAQILPDSTKFSICNRANKDEAYFAQFHIKSNNYIFDEELKVVQISEIKSKADLLIFGNVFEGNSSEYCSPDPEFIAMWAEKFGFDSATNDIDYLEPNYIKNFIVKEKN